MTINELQALVRIIANNTFCRYWLHWNHPSEEGRHMAIAAMDANGHSHDLPDLEHRGFIRQVTDTGMVVYIVDYTKDSI
jgi:hypothetical protein